MQSEFIYETAPYPSCHASTLVESRGKLLAAWFGGTEERNPDVGIWVAHYEDGKWTPGVEVANGVESPTVRYPCWNPVLFQPAEGPLLLFYKVGPNPVEWWGMLIRSEDGGATWSEPERLPDGILGPIKNKPIQFPNGDILCPTSTERGGWRVYFERLSSQGGTWQATAPINDGIALGAIQPSLLLHPDGCLQALGRTRQGRIFSSESMDEGRTWDAMTLLDLPNPNSGTDAVTLHDDRSLLVYNHSTTDRTPLNVALSSNGRRWTPVLTLENTPSSRLTTDSSISPTPGTGSASGTSC
jgi:predicted neuraminidase